MWILGVVFFISAGIWWALAHVRKYPTIRMLFALVAGTAGAIVASSWIASASDWYGREVAPLPSPWPTLLTVAPYAVFAAAAALLLIGVHPKETPDHTAEILAVCACAVLLFASGSTGPVMHYTTHITSGAAR